MWFRRHQPDEDALSEARQATDASLAQAAKARSDEAAAARRDLALAGRLREIRRENHLSEIIGAAFRGDT